MKKNLKMLFRNIKFVTMKDKCYDISYRRITYNLYAAPVCPGPCGPVVVAVSYGNYNYIIYNIYI